MLVLHASRVSVHIFVPSTAGAMRVHPSTLRPSFSVARLNLSGPRLPAVPCRAVPCRAQDAVRAAEGNERRLRTHNMTDLWLRYIDDPLAKVPPLPPPPCPPRRDYALPERGCCVPLLLLRTPSVSL